MKNLLVLDFDNTITDVDDSLSKKRADQIAKLLVDILSTTDTELILLSVANKAHIRSMVKKSKSFLLNFLIQNILLITEEDRGLVQKFDPLRNESEKKKNSMVMKVLNNPKFLNNQECSRAYKKTNSLLRLAKFHHLPKSKIFFLDDNIFNIKFAHHYGFTTFLIRNDHPTRNILQTLQSLQSFLLDSK